MKRRLLATAALCALAGMTLPAHAQQTIRLTAAAGPEARVGSDM